MVNRETSAVDFIVLLLRNSPSVRGEELRATNMPIEMLFVEKTKGDITFRLAADISHE